MWSRSVGPANIPRAEVIARHYRDSGSVQDNLCDMGCPPASGSQTVSEVLLWTKAR